MGAEAAIEDLLGKLEGEQDPASRVRLLREIATIFRDDLADPGQAFDALLMAAEIDIASTGLANALFSAAQAADKCLELLPTANRWLESESNPERQLALCLALAGWYSKLDRDDYAAPYLQRALQLGATFEPLLLMARLMRRQGRHREEGFFLNQALTMEMSSVLRADTQVRAAAALEKLEELPAAKTFYDRALESDPTNEEARAGLRRLGR